MRYREYVLAIVGALVLAGCSGKISDITGTTLDERCFGYRQAVATLDLVRAERELDEDEAKRRAYYDGLIITFCPPLPPLPPVQ